MQLKIGAYYLFRTSNIKSSTARTTVKDYNHYDNTEWIIFMDIFIQALYLIFSLDQKLQSSKGIVKSVLMHNRRGTLVLINWELH